MFPDLPLSFPMGGMDIAFYVVALVILLTAVCCVAVKNILQSAVFLIFSFVTTAILYMLMHAEFIALAQVMVYVGGVVISIWEKTHSQQRCREFSRRSYSPSRLYS